MSISRKPFTELTRQGKAKRLKKIEDQEKHSMILMSGSCVEEPCEQSVEASYSGNLESSLCHSSPPTASLRHILEEESDFDSRPTGNLDFDELSEDSTSEDECPSTGNIFERRDNEGNMKEKLVDWACKFQISHAALTALLLIIRAHTCFQSLPADSRTLLHTQRNVHLAEMNPGSYHHVGLLKNLKLIWQHVKECVTHIELIIGIDGLPLFKSSSYEVWPILCSISNIPSIKSIIFPIGIYSGRAKPKDSNAFLSEFVSEMKQLINEGIVINGLKLTVALKGFICDTPAKAFILNTKGHTGYYSCTKCTQKGVWIQSRMTFPNSDAPSRTHEDFMEQRNAEFHNGHTILTEIPGLNFVNSFPLDYMHLVCLGVMRTLLFLWTNVRGTKLPPRLTSLISQRLISLRKYIPIEFNRKPRSLDELKRWKATEMRQFLLYTGPVVLKEIFKDGYQHLYDHFLSLSISVYILASPNLCCEQNIAYAQQLLHHFVESTKSLYGEEFITYNMHNLIHLPKSIMDFGSMETSSAFAFENYLQFFKKCVRKGDKPLQQIIKRCSEIMQSSMRMSNSTVKYPNYEKNHSNGPLLSTSDAARQFSSIDFKTFKLSNSRPNSFCLLKSGKVVMIENVVFSNRLQEMTIVCKTFERTSNFYKHPFIDSSSLSVFLISKLSSHFMEVPVNHIIGKIMLLPYNEKFVAIPLVHSL